MANQVTVNKNNGIQVVIEPPANVQVEISRAVIGTVANVESANTANIANYANIAGHASTANTVTNNAQPNITSVGTLTNLAISGDLTTVDSITLDTAASEAYATAKMYWNTVDGTMNVGLYNGVIQQIGQEVHFYGKAQGNITNGQVVMFAGVQGNHILMAPANASAPGFKKEWIIGMATQDISNGSFGYVTWFGKINDVSTNGFGAGQILWFNPSVVGGLTNVEPTGNSIKVLMATVVKAETSPSANNGIYLVRPTFEPNINDIQGVKVTAPLQGQVMTYDSANSIWINANITANVSNVQYAANAGYANAAGEAYSVSASNISGIINLANYAAVANSVAGANVSGIVANANYASYAGNATIANSANSVAGANVSGEVANANYATYSGISYSVSGSNVSGQVANANFATTAQTSYSVDGANVSGDVSGANHANVSDVANSVSGSNVVGEVANAAYATSAGSATIANSANSVAGANVSGDVAGANHANIADVANSVTAANVSGLGNIATINLDGNASSVLLGNGYWGALPSTENANYANYAGTAYSVDGANVSGEVANAAYATNAGSANSVAGANVSGEVANANYASYAGNASVADSANSVAAANVSGLGNIASININGNTEQWLRGDGTWNALPAVTNVANANYSNFAGTAYSIDGANVSGDVAGANHANIADSANSVAGANVSGEVANANYASYAGNVTIAGQSNITSVGNLVNLTISNTANSNSSRTIITPLSTTLANAVWSTNAYRQLTHTATSAGSTAVPGDIFIRSRGTVDSPTTINQNDTVYSQRYFAYNGNANAFVGEMRVTATGPLNDNANAVMTNGQVSWFIGTGDQQYSNSNGVAAFSTFGFASTGTFTIIARNGFTPLINITSPGISDLPDKARSIQVRRYRSNNDGSNISALQPNDEIGLIHYWGTNSVTGVTPSYSDAVKIKAVVANTFAGNGTPMMGDFVVDTFNGSSSNSMIFTSTGNLEIPNQISGNIVSANILIGAGGNISNIQVANVNGLGNIATVNLDGNSSNVLRGDGTFGSGGGGATSPAGSNTQIQFNDEGTFGASANLFWDKSSNTLNVTGNIIRPANVTGAMVVRGSDSFLSNVAPGALQLASGNLGNGATPISASANLFGPITGIFGGAIFTDNVAGYRVTAGGVNIRAGNVTSNIANVVSGGGINLIGSTITYKVANSIVGTSTQINGSQTIPSANDYSVTGLVTLGSSSWNFSNANLRYSNGSIGSIATPFVNIGHSFGIGVELVTNTSNITVGNVYPSDALYMRTTGVGIGSDTAGNVNNVTFGNITTASMVIETGQFKKPTGSNVSNVTVGNLTTGDINFRTGGVNDISSVTGTFNRGNINLTAKAINFGTGGNGLYDSAYQFTFNSNGTANLANIVVANSIQVSTAQITTANIDTLNANTFGNIGTLNADIVNANTVEATTANANTVQANYISSNELQWNNGNGRTLRIWGSNTSPVGINMYQGSMSITLDNLSGGVPSFDFKTYMEDDGYQPPYTYFRASGTQTSPGPVANGTPVVAQQWNVYKDSGNTYSGIGSFRVAIANNPGTGGNSCSITTAYSAADTANSTFTIGYGNFVVQGTANVQSNIQVGNNLNVTNNASIGGVFKFGVYTISGKPGSGNIGDVISISDSTPNGMLAYWDGTNSRWSYVHDNSAV